MRRTKRSWRHSARALPAPVPQMLSQKLAPFMEKRQENELYL